MARGIRIPMGILLAKAMEMRMVLGGDLRRLIITSMG